MAFDTGVVGMMDLKQTATEIKVRAKELGFDLVGICGAGRSRYRDYFRAWLDAGRGGCMGYLGSRFSERTDVGEYFPGAQSVVCVAMNYYRAFRGDACDGGVVAGRIARYALGGDYHDILKPRLHALADHIRLRWPGTQTRVAVDTAPVMEKELAARAGIGWFGKNSCVIRAGVGSWLVLGEVITTLPLPTDEPARDHCGTCTRCIDACPTGAITSPYQLDARRCVSYLTIEHRGEISGDLQKGMGNWLYGCDICQEVCPHNRGVPEGKEAGFEPRFVAGCLDVGEVEGWTEETYRTRLGGSAMKRVKLGMLKRNAAIVRRNIG